MAPRVKVVDDHKDYHHYYDDYCVSVHSSLSSLSGVLPDSRFKPTNKTGHSQIQKGPLGVKPGQYPRRP